MNQDPQNNGMALSTSPSGNRTYLGKSSGGCSTAAAFIVASALIALWPIGAAAAADSGIVPARGDIVATELLPARVKASIRALAATDDGRAAPVGIAEHRPDSSARRADAVFLSQRIDAARELIQTGRSLGDPRTLGYAEAQLAPWPATAADAPTEVLVLRATIEQSRHNFGAARALLDRVLAKAPRDGQALLTRAAIAQVGGAFDAAAKDCAQLRALNLEAALVCQAINDAAAGANDRALRALQIAATRSTGAVRGWALGVIAQVHEQNNQPEAAAAAFRDSLAADDDLSVRLAYADLLLARNGGAAVTALLQSAPAADGVLLRRWLALRTTSMATPSEVQRAAVAALESQLNERFGVAAQRAANGELLHAREAALFALARADVAGALRQARANWQTQREPADLLVLARAARAAGDRSTRAQIAEWIATTGLRDARVDAALSGS